MKRVKSTAGIIAITLVATAAIVLPLTLYRTDNGYRSPTLFAMDTTLDITLQGRDEKLCKADVEATYATIKKLESIVSRFEEGSDVRLINARAGISPVKVRHETLEMVERSLEFARLTGGAFDITVAPVAKLWGFYDGRYRVPPAGEIARARSLVDYRKVLVDRRRCTVMLRGRGMEIDLGGVAKGYSVGEACDLLKARGVKSGLVNFGGAIGAIGHRADRKPWVVGIRNPRGDAADLVGELKVEDGFVSSSGDYERFFMRSGKRYCHIFDPATGRQPAGVTSVTVVGPDSQDADILSTALFVMGREKGFALLKDFPGNEALIIDGGGVVGLSSGMKKYVITVKDHIQ